LKKNSPSSVRIRKRRVRKEVNVTAKDYSFKEAISLVHRFGKLFKGVDLPLQHLMVAGNLKLPREMAIFNMSSATDCASLAMGKCKACVFDKKLEAFKTVCYALKAERSCYPRVLPYRRRQELFWKEVKAEDFAFQFLVINSRRYNKFDSIRLNEAGDFHGQSCVIKAEKIAKILSEFGIRVYCYTSRDDLNYSRVRHLVVNGSGFMKSGIVNEFKMVADGEVPPRGYAKCPMDCTVCDRCLKRGKKTYVTQH